MPIGKRAYGYFKGASRARRAGVIARARFVAGKRRRSMMGTPRALKRSKLSRNMHKFTRWINASETINATANEYQGAASWTFSQIVNPSEFTTLYDRYKITHIQLRVQLMNNPSSTEPLNQYGTGSGFAYQPSNFYPKFWYCPDYDDSTAEALDELKQRAKTKCLVLRPNHMYKINIKPAVNIQTYRTAVSTGYAPAWNQWIDAAQTDVPHYGLKYVIDNLGLNPNDAFPTQVRIDTKVWFTMKDVR